MKTVDEYLDCLCDNCIEHYCQGDARNCIKYKTAERAYNAGVEAALMAVVDESSKIVRALRSDTLAIILGDMIQRIHVKQHSETKYENKTSRQDDESNEDK